MYKLNRRAKIKDKQGVDRGEWRGRCLVVHVIVIIADETAREG